eukprot:Lithocolla_globosa_v1_NODE_2396_length_2024_cov_8.669375.p2 type:complete len:106 gc:universal NODE_2396_length_2024_cov_8.669375:558-241(-)
MCSSMVRTSPAWSVKFLRQTVGKEGKLNSGIGGTEMLWNWFKSSKKRSTSKSQSKYMATLPKNSNSSSASAIFLLISTMAFCIWSSNLSSAATMSSFSNGLTMHH